MSFSEEEPLPGPRTGGIAIYVPGYTVEGQEDTSPCDVDIPVIPVDRVGEGREYIKQMEKLLNLAYTRIIRCAPPRLSVVINPLSNPRLIITLAILNICSMKECST